MHGFAAGMVPHSDIIAISGVGWPAVNYTIAVITAGWGWGNRALKTHCQVLRGKF